MKKVSLAILGAMALVVGGCSNDDVQKAENAGMRTVTFTVNAPGAINSRAISDGTTVEDLYWVIFDENGAVVETFSKKGAFTGATMTTKVEIQLVNGKDYSIGFWAQSPNAPYTFNTSDGTVSVDYSAGHVDANDENRDAFYHSYPKFTCTSTFAPPANIYLTRPFAQVNVATADWATAKSHNATPAKSGMAFTTMAYSTLNLLDGSVDDQVAVEFALAALPDNDNDPATDEVLTLNVGGVSTDYTWIGMNYILVPATKEVVTTITFKHDYENGSLQFSAIPVQRNYRTNIVGNLLTSTTDWQIVIDNDYLTPDYDEVQN